MRLPYVLINFIIEIKSQLVIGVKLFGMAECY